MNTPSLRRAVRQDARTIRRLVLAGKINPTGLNWRRFILAENDAGKVIGCVQRKPHKDGSIELASLAVDETWRGRGIGAMLVEAVVAIHEGDLYLMCRAGLGSYYRQFGFLALPEEQLPKDFQRIRRFLDFIQRIRPSGEGLLILYQDCGPAKVDQYHAPVA